MFKFSNKGISTPLGIFIILLNAIAWSGIMLWYQYWWAPRNEIQAYQISSTLFENNENYPMEKYYDNEGLSENFIYMEQKPNALQIKEMTEMGTILYLDSWIPPVGSHPYGFIYVEIPENKKAELLSKSYIKGIESANRQSYIQ
jgi:hypothetical protein